MSETVTPGGAGRADHFIHAVHMVARGAGAHTGFEPGRRIAQHPNRDIIKGAEAYNHSWAEVPVFAYRASATRVDAQKPGLLLLARRTLEGFTAQSNALSKEAPLPVDSLATIPLFGDAEFYLPLKVAQQFNFPLSHHIIDSRFWGSIQDWLTGMLGTIKAAQTALDNFMHSDAFRELSSSKRELIKDLEYIAADGKTYQTAHGSEFLLYVLVQQLRATKRRPQVAAVKAFLAESGVIVGDMIRDPEGAAIKLLNLPETITTRKELREIRRATDSGYSFEEGRQRIDAREGLKEANKHVQDTRNATGLVTVRGHWIALAEQDFLVAMGITQEQWREINGLVKDINEHLSTADLVTLTYLKETIADLLSKNNPQTYTELYEMIGQIAADVQRVRRVYERITPKNALRPAPRREQRRLEDER